MKNHGISFCITFGLSFLWSYSTPVLAQDAPKRWHSSYNTKQLAEEIATAAHPLTIPVEELLSWDPARQRLAERWFEDHQAHLFQQIASGTPVQQIRAIDAAYLWISPWQRGQVRATRRPELMTIIRNERPVMRPVDHPAAAKLRTLLLKIHAANRLEIENTPFAEKRVRSDVAAAAQKLLLEIADAEVSNYFCSLLLKEEDPDHGQAWFACLEMIHGLPATYRCGGICGNCSEAEIKRYGEQQRQLYIEQRTALLTWLEHLSHLTEAERVAEKFSAWLSPEEEGNSYPPPFVFGKNRSSLRNLARLGPALVPLLRPEQQKQKMLNRKAEVELVIAAITGQPDEKLVRELLGREGFSDQQLLGCAIIEQAGDQRFHADLVKFLRDPKTDYTVRRRAAETLAILDRKAVLPLLRDEDIKSMPHLVAWLQFNNLDQ